jgi:hypothetical protein
VRSLPSCALYHLPTFCAIAAIAFGYLKLGNRKP